MELLLANPRIDPSADFDYGIRYEVGFFGDRRRAAATNGHLGVIQLLIRDPRVDASTRKQYPIRVASEFGYDEIVRVLLMDSRVDPSAENDYALRRASKNGHVEVVKILYDRDAVPVLTIL